MNPFYRDNHIELYAKDCRDLTELADNSVQCVVTSPPYWGLRKYSGEQELIWGDNHCEHKWATEIIRRDRGKAVNSDVVGQPRELIGTTTPQGNFCSLCGAWKGAYGLEPTPEMYVHHTIEILREIRRVLRKDGVVFWNIGDSYATVSGGMNQLAKMGKNTPQYGAVPYAKGYEGVTQQMKKTSGLKHKDLCLIPFRIALEAQKPYQEFTIKELSDRAWLAGIVDADGCIGIHHYQRRWKEGFYHQFQPYVSVGSSDVVMIERCASITRMNGTRSTNRPPVDSRGIKSNRPHHEWRVEGEQAAKVLEDIYPHLIVKERQARLAHAMWRSNQETKGGRSNPIPHKVTEYRLKLWGDIKRCNQREETNITEPPVPQHIEPGWWVRSVIIWSKPNPMPESVTDRPTESHEYILMLTKSGTTQYWTHRDHEGTRTQPKPDYRWVKRSRPKLDVSQFDDAGRTRTTVGLDQPHDFTEILNEMAIKPEGWTPKNKMGWERMNLWRGHDYYWDADAVRRPYSDSTFPRMMRGVGNHKYVGVPEAAGGGAGNQPRENIRRDFEAWHYDGQATKDYESANAQNPSDTKRRIIESIKKQEAGANIRTVWEFPTQPYPEAHFAVFPEKLPDLCIKAATPEVGCCSKCGAPWERITENAPMKIRRTDWGDKAGNRTASSGTMLEPNKSTTIGWQPTCKCNADKTPSIVLDPFAGAGTTLWVAKKLNRKAVGYELSEEYCELALERNRQQVML